MKKIYLLAGLVLGGLTFSQAQTQRTMLLEHFTQASCPPCATYNPAVQNLITSSTNQDKIVSIKYQTSWPGSDPMNAHNASEVASRVSLYSVTGVPSSVIDGNVFNGHPADWGQDTIDNRTVVTSPVEMELWHEMNEAFDSVTVHLKIKATEAISGDNLLAHMAIVEEHIHFNSPPGTNGETDFYNVMKKMLPDQNGTSIGSTMADGDSIEITESWAMANVYDIGEIAAIAWVQNESTDEVYQAVFNESANIVLQNNNDVEIRSFYDEPASVCEGQFGAKIEIRNNGNDDITSMDISYTVNGGTPVTTAWSGTLSTFESMEEDIDFDYTAGSNDNIEVTLSNINGTTDDYDINNTYSFSMDKAENYQNYVFLTFQADKDGLDNSIKVVKESDGSTVYTRDRFSINGYEKVEKLLVLEHNECYKFEFLDASGDGLGSGGYIRLKDGKGNFIYNGSSFANQVYVSLVADNTIQLTADTSGWTGVEELSEISMEVTPNPANNMVRIFFPNDQVKEIQITNAIGEIVRTEQMVGRKELNTDISGLESGVYFVRAIAENNVTTKKLVKQ